MFSCFHVFMFSVNLRIWQTLFQLCGNESPNPPIISAITTLQSQHQLCIATNSYYNPDQLSSFALLNPVQDRGPAHSIA